MGCGSSMPAAEMPASVALFFDGEPMAGKAEKYMGEMVADSHTLAFVGPHALPLPVLDKAAFGGAAKNLIGSFPDLTFNFEKATPKQNKDGSWSANIVVMGTHTGAAFTPMPGKLPPIETTSKCVKIGPEKFTLWVDAAGKVCKTEITPLGAGHPHGPPGFYLEIGGVLPPPPLPDMLMTAKLKDFDDWFTGFQAHATSTEIPMNGTTYKLPASRGSACDEAKTEVFCDVNDKNNVAILLYSMDMAKFGPVMASEGFVEMGKIAITEGPTPLVLTDAPPPGGPPPPAGTKVNMFFSYICEDPERWLKGFKAHGTSKTGDGMWTAEAKYTRSEFCDEAKTVIFRSTKDPKRMGGLIYGVDVAKMGEFMGDPSFAEIGEVLKFDMSSAVMKTTAPPPMP